MGLPSSSKGLLLQKHSINESFISIPLHSCSRRMTTKFTILCQRTSAARRTCTWCSSPIHVAFLKNLIQNFYSFDVLVNFRLHNHQYFYRYNISRKTTTQSWRVFSTHETDYSLPYANLVFHGLREIINIIIIIIDFTLIIERFFLSHIYRNRLFQLLSYNHRTH